MTNPRVNQNNFLLPRFERALEIQGRGEKDVFHYSTLSMSLRRQMSKRGGPRTDEEIEERNAE